MDFDPKDIYWKLGKETGFLTGLIVFCTVFFFILSITGNMPLYVTYEIFITFMLLIHVTLKTLGWMNAKS